ncbi:MAG: CBS domain-containing protein [Pseudomonadota bacterium]
MNAHDIMTAPAITTGPDTPLTGIVTLMLEHHISAVPIVDAEGFLIGIVSEGDLMRRKYAGVPRQKSWWLEALGGPAEPAEDLVTAHDSTARDVMTTDVHAINETALLPSIAGLLERYRIKRVPVLADGKVVGIVSRANLLQALSLDPVGSAPHPDASDRDLRRTVFDALAPLKGTAHLNLIVRAGTVTLWGEAQSAGQRQALVDAAGSVTGVAKVIDNLHAPDAE